jgi:hypothetical protein
MRILDLYLWVPRIEFIGGEEHVLNAAKAFNLPPPLHAVG